MGIPFRSLASRTITSVTAAMLLIAGLALPSNAQQFVTTDIDASQILATALPNDESSTLSPQQSESTDPSAQPDESPQEADQVASVNSDTESIAPTDAEGSTRLSAAAGEEPDALDNGYDHTFYVNDLRTRADSSLGDGVCATTDTLEDGSKGCTLYAAIQEANALLSLIHI